MKTETHGGQFVFSEVEMNNVTVTDQWPSPEDEKI